MTVAAGCMLLAQSAYLQAQPPVPNPCNCNNLAPCTGLLHNLDYSSSSGWSTLRFTDGKMLIGGGTMNYISPEGSHYNRMHVQLGGLAAHSNNFRAECRVQVNNGNAPGHYVMAFTAIAATLSRLPPLLIHSLITMRWR
jgi:hypothetical protein